MTTFGDTELTSGGVGGTTPFIFTESSPALNPFPIYSNVTLIIRPTTPLSMQVPPMNYIPMWGACTWFVAWDGAQDLTFIPQGATTLINGVNSNLVFTAGNRSIIQVTHTTKGYEIFCIGCTTAPPVPTASYCSFSRVGEFAPTVALALFTLTGTPTNRNIQVSADWTVDANHSRYTYTGVSTRLFHVVQSAGFDNTNSFELQIQKNGTVALDMNGNTSQRGSQSISGIIEMSTGDYLETFFGGTNLSSNDVYHALSIHHVN